MKDLPSMQKGMKERKEKVEGEEGVDISASSDENWWFSIPNTAPKALQIPLAFGVEHSVVGNLSTIYY
jgi:hypothetical protein